MESEPDARDACGTPQVENSTRSTLLEEVTVGVDQTRRDGALMRVESENLALYRLRRRIREALDLPSLYQD